MKRSITGAALAAALVMATVLPASPAAAQGSGTANRFPGMCLSLSGGSFANNTKAVQWPCSSTPDQHWIDIPANQYYYELKNAHSGKCLGVAAGSTAANAQIVIYDCIGVTDQRWRKVASSTSGFWSYVNMKSGMYISVSGASTASNARIVQWPYGDTNDQKWTLTY